MVQKPPFPRAGGEGEEDSGDSDGNCPGWALELVLLGRHGLFLGRLWKNVGSQYGCLSLNCYVEIIPQGHHKTQRVFQGMNRFARSYSHNGLTDDRPMSWWLGDLARVQAAFNRL
jgi:hypothetical protein